MRKVIVNSTPLIALAKINQLVLLQKLYGDVTVPKAVFAEVTAKEDSACQQLKSFDWIKVESVKHPEQRAFFKASLHDGEVEVMIMAKESEDSLAIIDDNAAKKMAKYLGLKVTGTIGILLKAKAAGYVKEVAPLLEDMCANKIFISPTLKRLVLSRAGEL